MQQLPSLSHVLSNMSSTRILCVGDVMLDHFSYGRITRISPEAPVPVFASEKKTTVLGGAGNVVRNLASLGVACDFVGVVGDDGAGAQITHLFKDLPSVTSQCVTEKGRRTTVKTRFVSQGQQVLRVDDEDTFAISQDTSDMLLKEVGERLPHVQAVILSDYSKGLFTPSLLKGLIDLCNAHGVPVIVDPKARDYAVYKGATFITPNASELHQATSLPIGSDEEVEAAIGYVQKTWGITGVLATRGSRGMTLHVAGENSLHLPTRALEVYDVSGAGDTVIATFAASLAAGALPFQAAHMANTAAGIVVAKAGTAVTTQEELAHALHTGEHALKHEKFVANWQNAHAKVVQWHREGFSIGFTNGCFDILHPGHISLLRQAKNHCDRLVLGLNSDASVKRLKGSARPINDETSRAQVLAALEDIDLIVIFDQDTPLEIITYLRPDVLVKGADYTIENVVGAKEVLSWGGEVVLADLEIGHSTTNIIARADAA
ncbi:MAG: bifunctional heptose 7-phosphate kinase/heptose 1-phosphate adenyltransferase [Candidatus Puniceispirillum sp.]|nr:bifunctional heptose 7-phosphate kinase/heptose 1-phosphate adenyltransferase [Candidatus Puniceispirillum sp.]